VCTIVFGNLGETSGTGVAFTRDPAGRTGAYGDYLDKGVFTVSPFETIDADGVGRLVQIAATEPGKPGPT
jgi:hypothetical protein